MEWIVLGLCALCGVASLLALLRASLKLEGPKATCLIVVGSLLAVATTFLMAYGLRGFMQ